MLYAIADLHFGTGINKTMDIFGEKWFSHTQKIIDNWQSIVGENDTVLIPGDISWANNLREAESDFEIIRGLNGRKIMLMGNHDFWWQSMNKVSTAYPDIEFLQNNFRIYGDYAICGTRGWICPNTSKFTENDMKIYKREQIRLRLSLDSAVRAGYGGKIIGTMHFPPIGEGFEKTGFTDIFEEYGVKKVLYGHIHGEENFKNIIEGSINGIEYELVSADYLDFMPKKISVSD